MINFFVEDITFDTTQLEPVPSWLQSIIHSHSSTLSSINYIFCSDEYLLNVNRVYLDHDYYTDIITFDQRDSIDEPIEADIFISIERVQENAAQLNFSFLSELIRVLVHGVLHLLGYDDHSETDRVIMRNLEEQYIELFHSQFSN
uniref:Endoribonuclease YbeY n=1 Tax=Roseihalotalea indica TaxID=2867963 RepID=A0AA49JFY9_9BACT|nr:rRNA maturation RNase YbeY [Tunicatimonas sp. TK19036]